MRESSFDFNYFDKILYINLAHRQDRKEDSLHEFRKLHINPEKIVRIEPLYDPFHGHRGCALAHSQSIEYALEHSLSNVLILEDDFCFKGNLEDGKRMLSHFLHEFENHWDVLLLGGNIHKYTSSPHEKIVRVHHATCAHAYAVNAPYMETLYLLFLACYNQMIDDPPSFEDTPKAIDQQWNLLMEKDRWYFMDRLFSQRDSFSDISQTLKPKRH